MRTLILRSQDPRGDARTLNTGAALKEGGHTVQYVAWRRGSPTTADAVSIGEITLLGPTAPFGALFRSSLARLAFTVQLFWHIVKRRGSFDAIYAIDLDTAFVGTITGRLLRKRVTVDYADFFGLPDTTISLPGKMVNAILLWLHRAVSWAADLVVLPDENRQYLVSPRVHSIVIFRNAPVIPQDLIARHARDLVPQAADVFYVGFIGQLLEGRGLSELLQAVEEDHDLGLVVGGKGPLEESFRTASEGCDRVHFLGPLPYTDALAAMAGCDCLIASYDPAWANNRVASPNKLFEAIALGKPIVVSEGTSIDKFVAEHGLGAVVPYGDVDALRQTLLELASRDERIRSEMRDRQRHLAATGWSGESTAANLRDAFGALNDF